MSYVAGNFTAGQQPTTAQWNQLWSNDASFNDGTGLGAGAVTAPAIGGGAVTNDKIANGAVLVGYTKTTAAEAVYTTLTDVPTMAITVTTTKANQVVAVFSQFQCYQGGYSLFQYTLDGTAFGTVGRNNTGVTGATSTSYISYMDYVSIPTVGSHTIKLQALTGSSGLRIINGEGAGRMVAISS